MICEQCNGTGEGGGRLGLPCFVCDGTGSVCDVCGEACKAGANICGDCEHEMEEGKKL